ncbi:hypothetical protein GJAV_G00183690, partial [Gymnothorax javanicus]
EQGRLQRKCSETKTRRTETGKGNYDKKEACKMKITFPNLKHRGVVGLVCCRRDWDSSQNRWPHAERRSCGYTETISQDIIKEFYAWLGANGSYKWTMYPKHTSTLWKKWLEDIIFKVFEWPPQSPNRNLVEN